MTFTASVSRGRLGCSQISHPTKQTQRSRQMGRSFILHQLHHNGLVEDATEVIPNTSCGPLASGIDSPRPTCSQIFRWCSTRPLESVFRSSVHEPPEMDVSFPSFSPRPQHGGGRLRAQERPCHGQGVPRGGREGNKLVLSFLLRDHTIYPDPPMLWRYQPIENQVIKNDDMVINSDYHRISLRVVFIGIITTTHIGISSRGRA